MASCDENFPFVCDLMQKFMIFLQNLTSKPTDFQNTKSEQIPVHLNLEGQSEEAIMCVGGRKIDFFRPIFIINCNGRVPKANRN